MSIYNHHTSRSHVGIHWSSYISISISISISILLVHILTCWIQIKDKQNWVEIQHEKPKEPFIRGRFGLCIWLYCIHDIREFKSIATYIHSSHLQLLFAEIAGHLKLYNMSISMYIFLHRNEFSLTHHSCIVSCFMAAVMRLIGRLSARWIPYSLGMFRYMSGSVFWSLSGVLAVNILSFTSPIITLWILSTSQSACAFIRVCWVRTSAMSWLSMLYDL